MCHELKKVENRCTNALWPTAWKALLLRFWASQTLSGGRHTVKSWMLSTGQIKNGARKEGLREGKGRRKACLVGLSFWWCWERPQRVMPCPSLCSLTTSCPHHPCHVGSAATRTWLRALESPWSSKASWARMDDSCGGGAWEVRWQVSHQWYV